MSSRPALVLGSVDLRLGRGKGVGCVEGKVLHVIWMNTHGSGATGGRPTRPRCREQGRHSVEIDFVVNNVMVVQLRFFLMANMFSTPTVLCFVVGEAVPMMFFSGRGLCV